MSSLSLHSFCAKLFACKAVAQVRWRSPFQHLSKACRQYAYILNLPNWQTSAGKCLLFRLTLTFGNVSAVVVMVKERNFPLLSNRAICLFGYLSCRFSPDSVVCKCRKKQQRKTNVFLPLICNVADDLCLYAVFWRFYDEKRPFVNYYVWHSR